MIVLEVLGIFVLIVVIVLPRIVPAMIAAQPIDYSKF